MSNAPQFTMSEVKWNDEEHYLAEAEHPDYGKVIMLGFYSPTGEVRILFKEDGEIFSPYALPPNLTPTGRRYTLTEV